MTDGSDDCEVGYKKPPRHSRFKPGASDNPRGRLKGVCNLGSDVKKTLPAPVTLNEDGRERRVSTQQAALLRLREKALKGDARALDRLLQLAQTFNNDAVQESLGEVLPAEDQAILDAFAEEVGSRSAHSGRKGGRGENRGSDCDE